MRLAADSRCPGLTGGETQEFHNPLDEDLRLERLAEDFSGAGIEINGQPGGAATQIIRYDASLGQFVTHPVGTALNNFTLRLGEGYFIRCTSASTWTLKRP
jgi:hypothetical protein